jgi:hypothetical protein
MISSHKVTEIYFIIDEFYKEFDKLIKDHLPQDGKTRKRNRKFTMSQREVMTIPIQIGTLEIHLRSAKKLNLHK